MSGPKHISGAKRTAISGPKRYQVTYHLTFKYLSDQTVDMGDSLWEVLVRLADQEVWFAERWYHDEKEVSWESLDSFINRRNGVEVPNG